MSAAEKQRRYRARRDADPERRQIYLNKEKEKWRKDREEEKKKKVADLSEQQKRAQRKQWRERKRKQRASAKGRTEFEAMNTPPLSPEYSLEPENAPQPGPSRRHDPPAIWAHLDPVLDMIRERYPLIKHLHVFSDGPATQYKQKGNFYLLSKEPFKKGFKNISWNFFEASHGKGAPDGIGATLKRSADTIVRHGGDIPNAEAMFHKLRDMGTSVELFFVGEDDVERKVKEIIDGPTLVPVKGTMKIHQVLSFSPGTIKYRDITCLCQADKGVLDCECYGLKEISLSQEASPHCTEGPTRPENITKDHIGQWCIINYDGEPYPGIILEVEEDVKVKCMHKNGTNKFHWPSPREDITWYRDDQVVCLMKEPTPLNKRSVQLERKVWDFLEKNWSCWSVA
ncbi:unnamed protein product [Oreochromis niloticus]|nr:unnamed protein product [Mustela putorius furo]